jgi:U3 small nucleolar RNA-associated protein 6
MFPLLCVIPHEVVLTRAAVKRVFSLFDRCVRRYPGDRKLWGQYLSYAQLQGGSRALDRLFARALQFHSQDQSLWLQAAQWEFSVNRNPAAARSMLVLPLRRD